MPDWDEDSPRLQANLRGLLRGMVQAARRRESLTVESARDWHRQMLQGLDAPFATCVGVFRGEPGLEQVEVRVQSRDGVSAADVLRELVRFEVKLHALIAELDAMLPADAEQDRDQLDAVIDLCAWVHAEWVRIHPFANGNGRTARLWANAIAMRYGLPPFVRLRPRPDFGYGVAARKAMLGAWVDTRLVFRQLLEEYLARKW